MNQTLEQLAAAAVLADAEYLQADTAARRAQLELIMMGYCKSRVARALARKTGSAALAARKAAKDAGDALAAARAAGAQT